MIKGLLTAGATAGAVAMIWAPAAGATTDGEANYM